jgi:hypothetical protein
VSQVVQNIQQLDKDGFLLSIDASQIITEAAQADVP